LNGGGIGGGRPAIHSNATSVGGWEKFKVVAIGGAGRSVDYDPSPGSTGVLPFSIQECETYGETACGTWTLNGDHFDARWDNGATATLTIERFDDNEVIFNRRDNNQDFAARYVGRRLSGNKIEGTVTWTAGGRSWSGTWTANW
jgi:hypothetical protein